MKKFTIYIATMLVMLMAASCAQEEVETIVEQQRKLTLTFNMEDSRSRALAEDALNMAENKVDRADVFFFDNSGDYMFHQLGLVPTTPTQANNGSWKMNVNVTVPSGITFNGGTYQVYVLANAQVASDGLVEKVTTLGTGATIESLQALTFTSALETQITEATRFIMDGVNDVTISAKQEVGGEIPLVRSAAKVVLNLEVFESIEGEDGKTYVPAPNSVKVSYHNGVKSFGVTSAEFFKTEQWEGAATSETAEGGVYQVAIDPFYSYPLSWDEESDHEPYMMLQMNWGVQSGSDIDYVPYYYRIPVNRKFTNEDGDLALERNNAYKINLEIGVLGSTDPGQVVTLESGYEIMDWGTLPINTEVRDYKYLIVEKDVVNVYNKTNGSVDFKSSDGVTVQILSITRPNYREIEASIDNIYTYENGGRILSSTNGFTLTVNDGVLNLHHELENNINDDDFDYVPYTVKVKIYHTNAPTTYVEEVTFIQYPAVYVENSLNEGTVDRINNDRLDDNTNTKASGFGYVMVNTLYADRYDYNEYTDWRNNYLGNKWQTVEGFDSSSKNPNMYIVTTTVLDSNFNYLLGDSRETDTYTDNQMDFTSVVDVNGKQLEAYRPTKEDRTDYLSPKFRISSAYGQLGTNQLSKAEAKKRCAAYQENGYPAGRWRLASAAELSYIATLCAKGALPFSLFGASNYWSATGAYTIDTEEGTVSSSRSSQAFLRCVYDDWYWGSDSLKDKTKYTWGDESTTEQLNAMASQQ